jgi:hypothetical protein
MNNGTVYLQLQPDQAVQKAKQHCYEIEVVQMHD